MLPWLRSHIVTSNPQYAAWKAIWLPSTPPPAMTTFFMLERLNRVYSQRYKLFAIINVNLAVKMDISHHYLEQGSGEVLILLHGNGEDCGYFRHQMEPFSRYYRVIAIDTRGHGQTPRGEAPFTIRQFAKDLLGFMDLHGIERADILGFSDGGNIAMVFALTHPERVRKLVLNGANLDASGVKRSVQIPIEIGYRMASLFAHKSLNAKKKAELLGLMVNDPALEPEELALIKAPTLVIAGTRDMIKDTHTRLIAGSIAGSKLVLIEGDHFIAGKCPEEFNRAVLDFLLQ
jgi:pimeloyl-ACP methyl ester carboxylesterase